MAKRQKGQAEVERKASQLERLSVEYVNVDQVKPNEYNPNRQSDHDFELLMRSMREDGFTQPIIAQRATSQIVDGEHRWRAAQALGYEQVPVVYVDMSPEQMRVSTLRHNRARGSEDVELAADVLRDLESLGALDWAQESLMLDDVELQRMIEDVTAADALAADEFSQGWEATDPQSHAESEERAPDSTESRTIQRPGGGEQMEAATADAIEAARERERKLAQAKTDEERKAAREEASSIFRLMLMFHGDDAELVKRVLGERGAEKLVAILRAHEELHGSVEAAEQAAAERAGVESTTADEG